jgi:hypothetical protein
VGFLDRLRGERADGAKEVRPPGGTETLIGAPANPPPQELVERLAGRCGEHPDIASAYLFQAMLVTEGEEPHLALGLVLGGPTTDDRIQAIAADMGEHAHPLRSEDKDLEIQVLDDESLPLVARSVSPFFERSAS